MLVAAAAAVALLATSAQAQYSFKALKDDRAAGRFSTFLPYNATQRDALVGQVETVLGKAWVNGESKLINYGSAADPLPTIRALRNNIANATDADLQLNIMDAFIQIRDLHTLYLGAGPHRCFFATTGVYFELIESADIAKAPRVVVLNKDDATIPWTTFLGADLAKITIGDELVSINGDSFVQWFEKNQFKSGAGANTFGGHRRALDYLNLIPGSINRLPADDTITFVFKSRATGENYTTVINYASIRDNNCWNTNARVYRQLSGGKTLPGASENELAEKPSSDESASSAAGLPVQLPSFAPGKAVGVAFSPAMDHKKASFKDLGLGPVTLNPTGTSGLLWGIWDPQGKNLGILRVEDFQPSTGVFGGIEAMRSLLVNELKDTNAVLIDLRDNGGGIITYANAIPQLFKPDFEPYGARFLYNDVMKRTFVDPFPVGDSFRVAYERTQPGSKYTEIGQFDDKPSVNTYGQAYLRPMGVLTNGRCYSACDMLSGNIQGSATGTVFGEDGQTGAGGANVLQLADLAQINPTDFKLLPFTTELTATYASSFSAGVRQSVRNGLNNGQLIEDIGIKSDVVVRARLEDILPGTTTSSQYDRIADYLIAEGVKTGKAGLQFDLPNLVLDMPVGPVSFAPKLTGMDDVSVIASSGKRLARRRDLFAGVGAAKHTVNVDVPAFLTGFAKAPIKFVGTSKGKQVVTTNRFIRTVPKDSDRVDATKPFTWDRTVAPNVGLYNAGASAADPTQGWVSTPTSWRIGTGRYVNNVDSDLSFFFTAPVGTKLSIKIGGSYNTEKDFDYLFLNVVDANGKVTSLLNSSTAAGVSVSGVSGSGTLSATRSLPYTVATSKFSLSLRFVSDGEVTGNLVQVTSLGITVVP